MRHGVVQLARQLNPLLGLRLLEPALAGTVLGADGHAERHRGVSSTARPPIASPTPVQLTTSPIVAGTRMIASPAAASRPDPQRNSAYGSSRK